MVGQTGITGMAIALPLTARGIDRLVDRIDHLSYLDALHIARQLVTATRSTHAGHQIATTQLGK